MKLIYLFLSLNLFTQSLVIIGDTQPLSFVERYLLFRKNNDSIPFHLFKHIQDFETNINGVIHLGDLVFDADNLSEWHRVDSYLKLLKNKKVYPLKGNHDYGSNPESFLYYQERFGEDSLIQSLKFDSIVFLLINCNFIDNSLGNKALMIQKFEETLARMNLDNSVLLIFVASHFPPFTHGEGISFSADTFLSENIVPLFCKSKKTAVFFSGHCHNFEYFKYSEKDFIVSGGGGGPPRRIKLNDKTKDDYQGFEKEKNLRSYHYLLLNIKSKNFELLRISYPDYSREIIIPFKH